jgi:hypothetical protein
MPAICRELPSLKANGSATTTRKHSMSKKAADQSQDGVGASPSRPPPRRGREASRGRATRENRSSRRGEAQHPRVPSHSPNAAAVFGRNGHGFTTWADGKRGLDRRLGPSFQPYRLAKCRAATRCAQRVESEQRLAHASATMTSLWPRRPGVGFRYLAPPRNELGRAIVAIDDAFDQRRPVTVGDSCLDRFL